MTRPEFPIVAKDWSFVVLMLVHGELIFISVTY